MILLLKTFFRFTEVALDLTNIMKITYYAENVTDSSSFDWSMGSYNSIPRAVVVIRHEIDEVQVVIELVKIIDSIHILFSSSDGRGQ